MIRQKHHPKRKSKKGKEFLFISFDKKILPMKRCERHIRPWIFFIILIAGFSNKTAAQNIIAYYSGNAKQIRKYPAIKCNEIIFSFCHLYGNRLRVDNSGDTLTIQALVELKKKNPRLKILLSLGGWGGCKDCSEVFSSDSGRLEFSASVLSLTEYFHTDGIDIDWEFPALAAYPEHPFKVEDKVNFTSLVQALRNSLGKSKEISVICAGESPFLEGSLDLPDIVPFVDRINLMTYDLIGSKTPFTGHHTSLYSTSWQVASADHAVRYLDSLKIPHQKIAIGSAFYAREYIVLENRNHGLHQYAVFKKFVTMKELRKNYTDARGYITYWDPEAKASYKYNETRKIYLTYDDDRSVAAKVKYVKEKGLNGIFFWELRLDKPKGGLADIIFTEMKK
jgi:chitinase